jgi:hypothetical protein
MKINVSQYLNPDQRKQFHGQKKHSPTRASAIVQNASFKNILLAILHKK